MTAPPSREMLRTRESQDIERRFGQVVLFIAAGLREKDELYDTASAGGANAHGYLYSPVFRHGLNMFAALCAECCDDPASALRGLSESSFIRDYATRDVRLWVSRWRPEAQAALSASSALEVGPLVELEGGYFCPTQECDEVLRFAEADLLGASQERAVYEFLREGTQGQYVLGRRLLVRHPILTWDEMSELKTLRFDFAGDALDKGEAAQVDSAWMAALLDLAYEPVPSGMKVCPTCGWTMAMRGKQAHCVTHACAKTLPADFSSLKDVLHDAFRLCKGVMRYICAPGKLEVDIAKGAHDLGFEFELWPEKDTADVMIVVPDGRRIAVDAKAYGSAERLAREIRDDFAFARLGADEVVYVVPDAAERDHPGYCAISSVALGGGSTCSCRTFSDFIEHLRGLKGKGRS